MNTLTQLAKPWHEEIKFNGKATSKIIPEKIILLNKQIELIFLPLSSKRNYRNINITQQIQFYLLIYSFKF
jgi:hypothetical protein